MAAASEPGSSKADLKKLLLRSKEEPVNCALGLGKDKQAIILVSKIKQPRALLKELEQQAGGALLSPCFGTAMVDADDDPKRVVLTVNKAAGGIAAKLKKTLKGTGFTKAVIRLEDGTVAEAAEEEEGEDEAAAAPAAPAASPPPPPPPPPPVKAAAAPDPAALTRELAALARRIPEAAGSDHGLRATLLKLATDANVNIKTNNLRYATDFIAQLREALRDALDNAGVGVGQVVAPPAAAVAAPRPQPAAAAAASAAPPRKEPLLPIWRDAKDDAGEQLGKLQTTLRASKHPLLLRIADQGLNAVTGRLQTGLQAALMDYDRASPDDAGAQAKVEAAVAEFRSFVQGSKLLPMLDANPFGVKLSLHADLSRALDEIDASLAA